MEDMNLYVEMRRAFRWLNRLFARVDKVERLAKSTDEALLTNFGGRYHRLTIEEWDKLKKLL